jgi:CRISPR-associated protein Csh2
LAFNGTINKNAAQTTGLKGEDVETFRDALWQSIPASPTRSKLNQYPKLYVEIIYNVGYSNGQFGDLRNYIDFKPVEGKSEKQVRRFSDLELNLEKLKQLIQDHKGEEIKDVFIKTSTDFTFTV